MRSGASCSLRLSVGGTSLTFGSTHVGAAGLGAACLTDLAEEADRSGRCLHLTVAAGNPARRLYERVGFTRVGESRDDEESPTDLWMKRLPTTRAEDHGQA